MNTDSFALRHIGPNEDSVEKMLKAIGLNSMDQLVEQTIPVSILTKTSLKLPAPITESEFERLMNKLAKQNKTFKNYIGLGYHPTDVPAVIKRHIMESPGWYTAYTPYQPEISQGRLEALLNFQTMITDLTGMEIANASLLDEATAGAEAMSMLYNTRTREQKTTHTNRFFVDKEVLVQTLKVIKTRARYIGIDVIVGDIKSIDFDKSYFGILIQYPGKRGEIPDLKTIIEKAKRTQLKTVVATDLLSLALIESPGHFGVDVVIGSSQRFGLPMGYGGPHAAFFATLNKYARNMPGRIIGVSKDNNGNLAYRMALQTREQHIKRDRATSNICTSQVLLAVMASMYAVYHGNQGLKNKAQKIHKLTIDLAMELDNLGYPQKNSALFDTLQIEANSEIIRPIAQKAKMNFWYVDSTTVCISLNELTSKTEIESIVEVFNLAKRDHKSNDTKHQLVGFIPENFKRKTPFLKHPVFNTYRSETALMRYIKTLENKDLSLTNSMIPLGSCTMKLNAASQLLPLGDPRWANIHPFAPEDQAKGYQFILSELSEFLTEITGLSATSLQPNSGAQGEFTGLMIIRSYFHSIGQDYRNICLIPDSAHGTNPASAVMAGMKVVVVKTDTVGEIDWTDFKTKANIHKENLAALMITYPSTHGVFNANIYRVTNLIHKYGGQVYMDGANMNAQIGYTNPKMIGADVCHLNLHKTFAIPHGGGGPGVGPVCVAEHLVTFLPSVSVGPFFDQGKQQINISAAPYGSPLVCLISYGYIKMLGSNNLKRCTAIAILNANYIQHRLKEYYPIVYVGENGRVAHELIIDCRGFRKYGVEANDIAKRLMDYGFHSPTLSFPIVGTLMIEPTESEDLSEIDLFCDALISIYREITSENTSDLNLLKNAPHTLEMVTDDNWNFPYSREKAAFPLGKKTKPKYWPSIQRVDEGYGDRNLICSCPLVEEFQESI